MKKYKICGVPLGDVHDYLFEMLQELDRICRKQSISYSIEGGTLLGAVKYGDFVPWDDDLDVVMLRPDYERFIDACKTELSDKFFLQNAHTDEQFPLNYTKIRYVGSKYVQKNYEFLDIHQGLFLDLYPLDYVTQKNYRLKMHLIGLFNGAKNAKLKLLLSPLHKSRKVSKGKALLYRVLSRLPLKSLNILIKRVMTSTKDGDFVLNLCNPLYTDRPIPAQRFREYTQLRFRQHNVSAVKDYDIWLTESFGDYQNTEPDEETRGPSHAIVECQLPKKAKTNIGVVTFHRADNYGAVLQTYALTHALCNRILHKGADATCEVVDYANCAIDSRYRVRAFREIPRLKTKIKHLLIRKHLVQNQVNFNVFRNTFLPVSRKMYDASTVHEAAVEYDVLITGSDQVWNGLLTDDDDTYFLHFPDADCRKIAYAASVGSEPLFFSKLEAYRPMLDTFDHISVRERPLLDGLIANGYDKAQLVLDPVFLLDVDDYALIESNQNVVQGNYILVYVIAFEKELYEFARELSKETGYKIVYINVDKPYRRGVVNLRDVSVPHFLALIKNASYVVTSSFHGIAFSLIYNREVYYQLSKSENNFNSRVVTLIETAGIQGRNITDMTAFQKNTIDWKKVNASMEKMKIASKRFLERSVFTQDE